MERCQGHVGLRCCPCGVTDPALDDKTVHVSKPGVLCTSTLSSQGMVLGGMDMSQPRKCTEQEYTTNCSSLFLHTRNKTCIEDTVQMMNKGLIELS